jgi:hypothetical protein
MAVLKSKIKQIREAFIVIHAEAVVCTRERWIKWYEKV